MSDLINATISFPINTPSRNGTIFTEGAVQKAFSDVQNKLLPIVDYTQKNMGKAIGVARPVSCIWSHDKYMMSNDCFMFEDKEMHKFDVEGVVNKSYKNEDGIMVIEDFRIMGVSIMEEKE